MLQIYTLPSLTKASEESNRIPDGCKETFLFFKREIIINQLINLKENLQCVLGFA